MQQRGRIARGEGDAFNPRRRTVLVGALAVGAPLVASGRAAAAEPTATGTAASAATSTAETPVYRSRPDIAPPVLTTTCTGRESDGLLLVTPSGGIGGGPGGGDSGGEDEPPPQEERPRGAAMYDNDGELVWWHAGPHNVLTTVTFRGRPALSMFTEERGVVLDQSYQEIASFSIVGHKADSHDFAISPDGSRVLLISYEGVPYDLSPYGGPVDGTVVTSIIQEQDAETGEVTWEWDALDHIPVDETHQPLDAPVVHFSHTNSVMYDTDGTIVMSAKETSTIYKIDPSSGEIIWRFGGKNSDFAFADPESMPSSQHDALRLPDGRLSVFDNGNQRNPRQSRGAVWTLDETAMTATLVEDLQPDEPVFTPNSGSNHMTESGNHLVSYGLASQMVEFQDGEPVFTGVFEEGTLTYRARRADWKGMPDAPPDVAWTEPDAAGRRTFYMSWNGATEVHRWCVEARVPLLGYVPVGGARRSGFETVATVNAPSRATKYRVRALDRRGHVIGTREITEENTPTLPD